MARQKKNKSAEDPGLNLGNATAVAPESTHPNDEHISTTGPAKQYEEPASAESGQKGSDDVTEMAADGRIDPPLSEAEATPALEAAAIPPSEPQTPDAAPEPGPPPILIEVVAPSLNRPNEAERLERALAGCAVPEGYELKINVQRETEPRALPVIINELVGRSEASIVVVLADHIVPKPNLIEAVAKAYEGRPDIGMVGLKIANMEPLPGVREYCFFALSRPFIEHFPDRQVFCPDYYHFYGDTELGRFAADSEAFLFAENAEIETFHVNNGLADPDDTWRASRSRKKQDIDTYERRKLKGLVWGKSFERVNP